MTKITPIKPKTETIDATRVPLGRLASKVAIILRGKNLPGFTPYLDHQVTIKITNASKMGVTGTKITDKMYTRHSGYPGSLRKTSLGEVITKKGASEAIRRAVRGMLPPNRMRAKLLKRLIIEE